MDSFTNYFHRCLSGISDDHAVNERKEKQDVDLSFITTRSPLFPTLVRRIIKADVKGYANENSTYI